MKTHYAVIAVIRSENDQRLEKTYKNKFKSL